ncbi:diaminopimelate epimerase [Pseudochelatococcus lubricantis]|uniref:Diaminopimelate epimerase n=1 Tax=Pseudochelatococcus lubricantis TaxID=1538102 RepID=A0ABX0UYD4_9HYPH|nr:diaminopimelate epimerase [Pseudochelatococcus lubricantis]NIJ57299.1 diaminopimelate epimerase [Pseudochelatococcus lubricantis]
MNTLANLPFLKMNGLGNEIIVLDLRGRSHIVTEREARAIGRFERARFEQLMVLHDPVSEGTDAFVRIYNADGSEAGACGNGTRCVAWAILRGTDRRQAVVETAAGVLACTRQDDTVFTVDMGAPRFAWEDIPLAHPVTETAALPLHREAEGLPALEKPFGVSMGNPHAIFFVSDAAAYDLTAIGPSLEHDPLFPERANISLAQVLDSGHLLLRVWERGAGETRACGSGACAAAVAAMARGLAGRRLEVQLPGGALTIEWRDDGHVLMTGPTELEWADSLPPALFQDAAA